MAMPGRDPVPSAPVHHGGGTWGGYYASASITIRVEGVGGWNMPRLPTVAALFAVVIAALYHNRLVCR